MSQFFTKPLLGILAGVSLGVAGVGLASAAGPEVGQPVDEPIQACAKTVGGQLRLSDECRPSEAPLEWNAQGPQGPAGPPGISDLQVHLRESTRTVTVPPLEETLPGDPTGSVSSGCEPGETVLSGGITAYGPDLIPLKLINSGPFFDGTRSGWSIVWVNPTEEPITVTVDMSALCTEGSMSNP